MAVVTRYPSRTQFENFEIIRNTPAAAIIFIGHPKHKDGGLDPKIQVGDVFISLKDIPVFISRSTAANDTKNILSVILAADSSVRKTFMDSVLNTIPKSDSIRIFRLVKARESDELGLEQID